MKFCRLVSISIAIAICGCALPVQPHRPVLGEVFIASQLPDKANGSPYAADGTSWTTIHASVKKKQIYALATWKPAVLARFGNCEGNPLKLEPKEITSGDIKLEDIPPTGYVYIHGAYIGGGSNLDQSKLEHLLREDSDDVQVTIYVRTSDLSGLQSICMQFYGAAMFGPSIRSDVVPVARR